jgi:hypothetical protein
VNAFGLCGSNASVMAATPDKLIRRARALAIAPWTRLRQKARLQFLTEPFRIQASRNPWP